MYQTDSLGRTGSPSPAGSSSPAGSPSPTGISFSKFTKIGKGCWRVVRASSAQKVGGVGKKFQFGKGCRPPSRVGLEKEVCCGGAGKNYKKVWKEKKNQQKKKKKKVCNVENEDYLAVRPAEGWPKAKTTKRSPKKLKKITGFFKITITITKNH